MRAVIGRVGEDFACQYFTKRGCKVIERNWRTRYGEIDIICRDGQETVFIEVKTRSSDLLGAPYQTVGVRKVFHIRRAVQAYIVENGLHSQPLRIDVVSILLYPDLRLRTLQHFKNARL